MKRKRQTPEQIIAKLRGADALLASGATIGQVCQKLEISEQTFHRWRNQCGGMKASEAKRLKQFEQQKTRLKKLVAELSPDNAMLKELASGNWRARHVAARRSSVCSGAATSPNGGRVGWLGSRARRSVTNGGSRRTKRCEPDR